jgi:hypothetical protein
MIHRGSSAGARCKSDTQGAIETGPVPISGYLRAQRLYCVPRAMLICTLPASEPTLVSA